MGLFDEFTSTPARVWICGDCGSEDLEQHAVAIGAPHRGMFCNGHGGYATSTSTRRE